LILTRRSGETIIIGDDVKVTVLSIDRNQIRIGIDAPEEVDIVREELLRDDDGQDVAYPRSDRFWLVEGTWRSPTDGLGSSLRCRQR